MIREVKCSLKYCNKNKIDQLNKLFEDYKINLIYYIELIKQNKLPLKLNLTSKCLPTNRIKHSQWKQIIYKQASEIIRSNLKYIKNKIYKKYQKLYAKCKEKNIHQKFINKRFNELKINYFKRVKININNLTINIDQRLLSIQFNKSIFDEYLGIRSPYFYENKKRVIQINIPIKYHKHYNKFIDWKRNNTIKLKKVNNIYFIYFTFEKQEIKSLFNNDILGIDIGYKKLISDSNGKFYGKDIERLCNKISRKKRDSKNYKQALTERTNYINQIVNEFNCKNTFDNLIVEDLKQLKYKSKFSTEFNNKIQYWSYKQVLDKLERLSEIEGFKITKVNPKYTSQTCSNCNITLKSNRKGEIYKCDCGLEIDADYNAAINILRRGVYSPSGYENLKVNECNIC